MKKSFSTKWNSSKAPAKQRKYRENAPLHIKHKFLSTHLSKALRDKYGRRNIPVITGDKVKILRGQFKGRENKVERVDQRKERIYVTGVERAKKDGSKSIYPIKPSNVMITELKLDDKKRKEKLQAKTKSSSKEESKNG